MKPATAILVLILGAGAIWADDPKKAPPLIIKPDAFRTLVNPDCSHCKDEAKRRKEELRETDPVLCWIRDTKGQYNGGAIPYRFFLNPFRVISDSYGVFVYDPDAGFARGFEPSYDFTFHGWRNGVMVMKHKDGTLFSCLTGKAFAGPRKGERLNLVPTITTQWGYWLKHYPDSVAYHMYEKYKPTELPTQSNDDSKKSRGAGDSRLPDETMVLGVADGQAARAYPLDLGDKAQIIYDTLGEANIVVFWEPSTHTATAYWPQANGPGVSPPTRLMDLLIDEKNAGAPYWDKKSGSHFDIAGRAVDGKLKGWTLTWVDSTQVKWFAWAAEYPETTIFKK